MGRRSDHTQEEIKELIINASIQLITEAGPSAFGTRAIAKKIGYSFGTIYHIYGDLENLRYHVKGRILDNWHLVMSKGLNEQKDKVRYLVNVYIDLSERHSFLWAFIFALPSETRDHAPTWYIEKVERLFSLVVDAFESCTANRDEAETAARAMWPGIHGICVLALSGKLQMVSEINPRELSHHLLATYLKGLTDNYQVNVKNGRVA